MPSRIRHFNTYSLLQQGGALLQQACKQLRPETNAATRRQPLCTQRVQGLLHAAALLQRGGRARAVKAHCLQLRKRGLIRHRQRRRRCRLCAPCRKLQAVSGMSRGGTCPLDYQRPSHKLDTWSRPHARVPESRLQAPANAGDLVQVPCKRLPVSSPCMTSESAISSCLC